jgi:Zn-dependent M28 family amino/carboxypeptidase
VGGCDSSPGGGFGASVSPAALRAHLEFLADDALEGRLPGTRGYDVAAKYMAAQFAALGLDGAAENGTYFQRVPLRRTEVVPEATSVTLTNGASTVHLGGSSDLLVFDTHQASQGAVSAPVVFAGYGVSAPELGYDDYQGLDVAGKIVAFLAFEAPARFPPAVRGYYMDLGVKRQAASDHGAVGVLGLMTPAMEAKVPWKLLETSSSSMRWLDAAGKAGGIAGDVGPSPILSRSAAQTLFEGEPRGLAEISAAAGKGDPPRFPTSKVATVTYASRHTSVEGVNVIAVLEGTDPVLKREHVVFTSHLDHLGVGAAVGGDAIYNGALDNASGCAVLLEVARAFSRLAARPRRSVLFAALTAEEQGLVGSDYLAQHSPVPVDRIVAVVNVDAAIPLSPGLRDVLVFGREHSGLGPVAVQAAVDTGFEVSPDPFSDQGVFVRTDHFPFVKQGIPALHLAPGYRSSRPQVDALEAHLKWLATTYHSPKDDGTQPFDYETGARFARFVGLVGYRVAVERARPTWNEGDFFGSRFGRGRRR